MQRGRICVNHVAQNLSRHHDDVSTAVDGDITGEQANCLITVLGDKVVVFLITQGFNRRGVKHFVPCDKARDTANSPTMVLPAPVGAHTSTPCPSSTASQPATWKSSRGCDNVARNSSRCG